MDTVVGLLSNADLPAGFSDWDTPVDVDLSFSQLVDDLFRTVGPSDHLSPIFCPNLLTL